MDLLDSVMELLNSTPSPPINVVNHQLNNSEESLLLENSAEMEPNNLSQTAARVVATVTAAAGETIAAAQTFSERNLELKLPILSSSSSDSESEEPANPTAGTSVAVEGERAASPPPNCAICLGRCKNKCFTDSCMHQFCFKCLCEWSKVKPECPLCKQTFKSIIHNVKSIDQFEEYHVQPPTVQLAHPPFEMDFQEMRILGVVHPGHNRNHAWNESTHRPFFYGDFSATSPYSSASTGGGSLSTASGSSSNRSIALSGNGSGLRNQYVYRGELLDLYRQEYPGAIANSGTLSQLWRRYVYDRKLYAMPVADITGRFRESSARFYRDNPSQIHRLMPWINRDIVCLLRLTQHDVTTVLESINSSLTLMNILSPAFRRRLQPFLGTKTAHFIHELNNFARSPYDMIGYDRAVQYSPQSNNEEIVIEFTTSDESSDNEQIDVAGDEGGNNNTISSTSRSRSTNASSINAINLTIHNRLTSASVNAGGSRGGGLHGGNNGSGLSDIQDDVSLVIDLRGESDNNETTSTAQATTNSSNYQNGQNAGTSEGDIIMSGTQPAVSENIELTSGSSDECEFILERKPPHLRTPEMVSLDSASDSDVVFVEESKALNKTSFSSSEGEQNDGPSDHKHHSRHHNKIAALVESKKRNHSGNLVKSEQQDSQIEVYNLGASTSAALRLSLQKRVDTSHRSDNGASSSRVRRDKYSLRNSDSQSRTERQAPKRRGKCLDSESSHSSTSSSTTISSSSSSTTSSSNSSSSSSDEEYVASTSQRRKTSSTVVAEGATRKPGHKVKKTKKRKASNSNNRRTNKHDSRRRKKTNNDYSSDDDDDNGHMGKNFALVMAINERQKRQNQKCRAQKSRPQENDDEEASEGENSWRLKAVIEPLRKQQQQRAKSSHKSNERKRQRKTPTQQQQHIEIDTEHKNYEKRKKYEKQAQQESESQYVRNFFKTADTSSDESDNINLVQLKTKLIGQDRHKEQNLEDTNTNQEQETTVETTTHSEKEMTTNNWNNSESDINATATATNTNTNTPTVTTVSTTSSDHSIIPTTSNTYSSYVMTYSPPTMHSADAATHPVATASETTTNNIVESTTQNDLLNFTDDSNDNDQNERIDGRDHVDDHDSNSTSYHNDQQQLPSSSMDNYHDNTHGDDNNEDDLCDDDENLSNMPTNKTLNENNVFADGTSMSTTTTDTILHDAAEQISSAAVNFYNPQQTFNTADFADENSTNSSSSDSSMSSSTTSLSSSSNSSSSNTNSYINYEHS